MLFRSFLAAAIDKQMARYNHQLDFRLDWFIGRKEEPLRNGEVIDAHSRVASLPPQTISGLVNEKGGQISDHNPITVDVRLT